MVPQGTESISYPGSIIFEFHFLQCNLHPHPSGVPFQPYKSLPLLRCVNRQLQFCKVLILKMSSLADEIVIELEPKTKRGRRQENEDRLGDLPDCVLLHVLSFLNAKHAVRTCVLSKRWNHLWKRIPALLLHSSYFSTLKSFDKFVFKITSLRDASIALHALDFNRRYSSDPPILRKIASYILSHRYQLQQLIISFRGDSSLILPCISSCLALTSLRLNIYPKGRYTSEETLFPKSLNLPVLTTLDLTNFAFCATDNADCAEPFSAFNSLNGLTICSCTVKGAKILSISSATLVNLTMRNSSSDFTKIELSAPSLSTFTLEGIPYQKLCGSTLSFVKQLHIDADTNSPYGEPPLILLSWLLDLPNIKSLTITSSTLLVLSLVPDLLNLKLPSLGDLKSLKVKWKPVSIQASIFLEVVMLKNKSRKEAAKIKKAFKAGLEPATTIPDRIVGFLLQNSPSAEVDIIDYWNSRKPMLNDTPLNEDAVEKCQTNTHFPPLDNGP